MRWVNDLVLGVRLAVGGGRTSWTRLALSAVGITIATAVLLVAASVGHMTEQRELRQTSDFTVGEPVAGVAPVHLRYSSTEFRGQDVDIVYVHADGPNAPKPAGLPGLPAAGEMYASPALRELLRSDEGELLRPRLPEHVVGTMGRELVPTPGELRAWIGADESLVDGTFSYTAYGFGGPADRDLNTGMLVLALTGAVVLLLPVVIFISSASRIAGAERDRRLSALRLVGAGPRQVRRIAAAEALVGAVVGMVAGSVLFAVGRRYAEDVNLFGLRVYVSDVVPDPLVVVLVVLLVPAIAVLTAMVALRRTIIEPLGVVRQAKPLRRRAWWRFALVAVGVVLLTTQLGTTENTDAWAFAVVAGATLVLFGVPLLLPWLIERVAGRLRGGPPSWLLAIRRLQLDSGTSARVIGGVAVVLAGTIALQTVLLSVEGAVGLPGTSPAEGTDTVEARVDPGLAGPVTAALAGSAGVEFAHPVGNVVGYERGVTGAVHDLAVLDCAALRDLAGVRRCADGDVFQDPDHFNAPPAPGTALEWRRHPVQNAAFDPDDYEVTGRWTLPEDVRRIDLPQGTTLYQSTLVTPGAVEGSGDPVVSTSVVTGVSSRITSDQMEGLRNAVADLKWGVYLRSEDAGPDLGPEQRTYLAVRAGLFAASVFTLVLAGVSLLVLALEQIRERRRPLAVLAASGVPRGVLGRSLLWQTALPIVLGVGMAMVTGLGLAALMLRLTREQLLIDWPGVVLMGVGAIALSLLVSAMTLPFLRSATRLTALRTE